MDSLRKKARITRVTSIASYIGLMVLFTLWFMVFHPLGTGKLWVIWAVHVLPLAGFIPSILSGNPRSHAWLCFVLLLYFIEAILAVTTSVETRTFGLFYTALVTTLFTSAMLYARWGSQFARLSHEAEQASN
ncbi:DUF2069 domain-containing protein [Neptunomonas antarctica]|uniref:Uncharacterized membrane protein n=1 Tax=Neptunomonas antarctica TaxID=619304 RepID=A0A1N7JXS0_9GAMM|nr:DUF2069 domain-containing protein [Neptunomonas antarctica]SIS54128.1 Uncharacterized membrane protein [Neptunomonas antarctica]